MSSKNHFSSLILKPNSIFFCIYSYFCYFLICTHASKPRIKLCGRDSFNKTIREAMSKYELWRWPGLGVQAILNFSSKYIFILFIYAFNATSPKLSETLFWSNHPKIWDSCKSRVPAMVWAGSIVIFNFSFKYIIHITYIWVKCDRFEAIWDDLLE